MKTRIGKLELYSEFWRPRFGFHEELSVGIVLEHFAGMHYFFFRMHLVFLAFHLGAGWWRVPLKLIPK